MVLLRLGGPLRSLSSPFAKIPCSFREFASGESRGFSRAPFSSSLEKRAPSRRASAEKRASKSVYSDASACSLDAFGGPGGPPTSARFPRPDLDVEAFRREQQRAQGDAQWQLVTTQEVGPLGPTTWRRMWGPPGVSQGSPSAEGPPAAGASQQHCAASDEAGPALSPTEKQEGIRGQQGQNQSLPPPPLRIDGAPVTGGPQGVCASGEGGPSNPGAPSFFSEGPQDWRLLLTEELDADWARLSGGPSTGDTLGAPWGAPSDPLCDKRLKVFIPELGAPKPIALLNRYQLLQTLERPLAALGLAGGPEAPGLAGGPQQAAAKQTETGDGGPQQLASPIPTLPPEVYEALVERAISILPSLNRQQLLHLLLLQQQHIAALQQQQQNIRRKIRILNSHAAAQQQGQQQQQQQELVLEEASRAEAAAAAAARSLKALQHEALLKGVADEALAHLPHMPLEELGVFARFIAVSAPMKELGLLQVVSLHAVDRAFSAKWGLLQPHSKASMPRGGLALGILKVLQPLALGVQRLAAAGAPRRHSGSLGGPSRAPHEAAEGVGELVAAPLRDRVETGGGLGFACRRLLEALNTEEGSLELQSLTKGPLLQLLLCCCSVGCGESVAPQKVAGRCLSALLGGPHVEAFGAETAQGAQRDAPTLEETLSMFISCLSLESRGGPPSWLLPLLYGQWGRPLPSAAQGPHGRDTLSVSFSREAQGLRPQFEVRCCSPSAWQQVKKGHSAAAALLSVHQLQVLVKELEAFLLPSEGPGAPEGDEALLSALLQQTQQQLPGPAAGTPDSARGAAAAGVSSLQQEGLESWALRLEVAAPSGASAGAPEHLPFDYLEDEASQQRRAFEVAELPAAAGLAAIQALAWALTRLLQQLQQQQQQQQSLLESIKSVVRLLSTFCVRLVGSAGDPLLSLSARVQGAHALADAAELLAGLRSKGLQEGPLHPHASRLALALLLGTEEGLLRALSHALQREEAPSAALGGLLEALCCSVSRSLGALKVLGPLGGPPAHAKKALDTEDAAAAGFLAAATDCLRCFRLKLSEKSLTLVSLRVEGLWLNTLGALLQRQLKEGSRAHRTGGVSPLESKVAEEAMAAALSVGEAWGLPNGRGSLLLGGASSQETLEALEGYLLCLRPFLKAGPLEDAAAGAPSRRMDLIQRQLTQLSLLEAEGQQASAVAAVSRQLLLLLQKKARQEGVVAGDTREASAASGDASKSTEGLKRRLQELSASHS